MRIEDTVGPMRERSDDRIEALSEDR